jgi:hypothetical protein
VKSIPPQPSSAQCWSGVDWLTVHTPDPSIVPDLQAAGIMIGRLQEEQGAVPRPFNFRGYRGEEWPNSAWGIAPRGALVRVWGGLADHLFDWLHDGPWATTRLDYQVTHKFDPPRQDVHEVALADHQAAVALGWRKVSWHYDKDDKDGNGVQFCSRNSRRYLRLYHKEVQSQNGDWAGCWRWEVEYKRDYAVSAADRLAAARRREQATAGTVCAEFQRLGINVPWRDYCEGTIRGAPREPATELSTLDWYWRVVIPNMRRMSKAGHLATIRRMIDYGLGLGAQRA